MGIARRKAGATVDCTNCARPVRVPSQDEGTQVAEPTARAETPSDVFDRDDFSQLLQPPTAAKSPPEAPFAELSPPLVVDSAKPAEPVSVAVSPGLREVPGLVLSPTQATILTVTLIVLLAGSFLAGLLIGRFAL
jgi:hypothetical protein